MKFPKMYQIYNHDYSRDNINNIETEFEREYEKASMAPAQGKIPCIEANDREAIEAALATAALDEPGKAKIIRIKNTNNIEKLWVSEALYEELKDNPDIELLQEGRGFQFDEKGHLEEPARLLKDCPFR